MTREVTVPAPDWAQIDGVAAVVPVKVNWPELRLTESQVVANTLARLDNAPEPYPDHSTFYVVIERPA